MLVCIPVREKRTGVDLVAWGVGKDLGGVEGEETIIRMHFMKKKSILNIYK